MRRRAESAQLTRRRITEAAVRLHTSIGPANASLRAVAKEAGVTRVTLARHFASADELFVACMAHWTSAHTPPDPAPWLAISDFDARVRMALRDIYAWFAEHWTDLLPIYRDAGHAPESYRRSVRAIEEGIAEALLAGFSSPPERAARRRAVITLVVGFWGWHALTIASGLGHDRAADLAAECVLAA
jgi:AcrR family transcriptional regulator